MLLRGKIAVITGGTRGIGYATVKKFLENGAKVVLFGSREETVAKALASLRAENPEWEVSGAWPNLVDAEEVAAEISKIREKYGRIDILINNAGLSRPKSTVEVLPEDFDVTVQTKFQGYFFMSQAAARDMLRRGEGGTIVQIGSVQSTTVIPGQAVYASVNAGIVQMTRSLAREWGKAGIRVNCIAPGSIHTPENEARYADPAVGKAMCEKIPLGYRGYVEQVADAAFFLTGERSAYITGQTLSVDGGLSLCRG